MLTARVASGLRPAPSALRLADRRVVGRLHDGNAIQRVRLVVVGLAGDRDGLAVAGDVAPAPEVCRIAVEIVVTVHSQGDLMSEMKRYLVSYRFDGSEWNIELPAESLDDARQRL